MVYPSNWLADPSFPKCLVARVKYYDTAENTVYLSSHAYTGIIDGAERVCIPRISDSPNFELSVSYSDKDLSTNINYGFLPIMNSDGKFDEWMDYGFDGRSITLFIGPIDGQVDTDFVTIFDGIIDRLTIDNNNTINLTFRDFTKKLDKPIQDTNYQSGESITFTTNITKTVSITSSLANTPKPIVYGQVYNIEPVLLNAQYLVYQVSNEAINAITAVYDRGVRLNAGSGYRVDLSKGILELVNNPSGTITCDVQGISIESDYSAPGTKVYSNSLGNIIREICYRAGISNTKLLKYPYSCNVGVGIYIRDRSNCLDVIDSLMSSVNGFVYFDNTGNLIISSLVVANNDIGSKVTNTTAGLAYGDVVYSTSPTVDGYILASDTIAETTVGYSLSTLSQQHILIPFNKPFIADSSSIVGDINIRAFNIPNFRTKVGYQKNYTVQTDIAAGTLSADREFMAVEYRSAIVENLALQSKFLSSIERVSQDTQLINSTQAGSLASGLLARYGRQIYTAEFTMLLTDVVSASLGSVVKLVDSRFGLSTGRMATISRISINYLEGIANLAVDFYTYPYIGQYYEYLLASMIRQITGTSTVSGYTVSVPAGANSVIAASQYKYTRRFEYLPNITTIGESSLIKFVSLNSSGNVATTYYQIVFTVLSATQLQVQFIGASTTTFTIPYTGIEALQIMFDFNSKKCAVIHPSGNVVGGVFNTSPTYLAININNASKTSPSNSQVIFIDSNYSGTTYNSVRWLEISKQEVPTYLTLEGLELENGTYLLV